MLDFYSETQDWLEQQNAGFIIKCIPNYARFWEQHIGICTVNNDGTIKLGRCLTAQNTDPVADNITKVREKISELHYSQLVHFVGAKDRIKEIEQLVNKKSENEKGFIHKLWYPFYCAYAHLYSARDLEKELWCQLYSLMNGKYSKIKFKKLIDKFQLEETYPDIRKLYNSIGSVRNDMVHWTRQQVKYESGKIPEFYVSVSEKNQSWNEKIKSNKGTFVNPLSRATEDFNNLVECVDFLREKYNSELNKFYDKKGYTIENSNIPTAISRKVNSAPFTTDSGAIPSTTVMPEKQTKDISHNEDNKE